MNTHNEPWKHDGDGDILDANNDDVACAYLRSDDVAEDRACRIVACVNACAGMADPAAEIAALRAEVERLKATAVPAPSQSADAARGNNEPSPR